jgi:transmembrane sensor
MNYHDRFTELLNLYLNDMTTVIEREELMQLIREGSHDETIRDGIHAMLLNGPVQDDMDPRKARKMLEGILATGREERKIIPMRPKAAGWKWVAAAAVLVIAVSVGWWISSIEPVHQQLITRVEEKPESVIYTGKQFVHLPDGSSVLLNEGSELSYSRSFGDKVREVTLRGEGYFDVQHDQSKPFKVLTGKVTTTVLGTIFNVKAYAAEQEIEVTVTRGRVQVSDDERTFGIISTNQQMAVNTATNDFVQTDLKAEATEALQSRYLILDDVSMEEAAKIIAKKYNVKITLANDNLKMCRISATFLDGEDLEQVLTVVSGVVQATYTMQPEGNVKIEGRGCK